MSDEVMKIEPRHSHCQPAPAEWLGGRLIIEKWLRRFCSRESLLQFASSAVLAIIGLGIVALTFLALLPRSLLDNTNPLWIAALAAVYLIPSTIYAYRTRWGAEAATRMTFDSSITSATFLLWEILSAGPIFLVMAAQEFYKFVRLWRVDFGPVSALLLWLFDEGGRASFAEISLAFPGLNAVRVLPQLRDIPGIHWWPDEGRISLGQSLRNTLIGLLHREPKRQAKFFEATPKPPPRAEPPRPPLVPDETLSWYAALNLPPFATLQQVKVRYRKLAKIYHPDARARIASANNAASDEQMKRINEAYHNILKHSQNRAGGVD